MSTVFICFADAYLAYLGQSSEYGKITNPEQDSQNEDDHLSQTNVHEQPLPNYQGRNEQTAVKIDPAGHEEMSMTTDIGNDNNPIILKLKSQLATKLVLEPRTTKENEKLVITVRIFHIKMHERLRSDTLCIACTFLFLFICPTSY